MRVRFVTLPPSTHCLFQFRPEGPRNHVSSRAKHNLRRQFKRKGKASLAYQSWGRVGMLLGVMESISDMAIEGNLTVTVSDAAFQVTGQLSSYSPGLQPIIQETLIAIERIAADLAHDPQVVTLNATYTQEILEIWGNCT